MARITKTDIVNELALQDVFANTPKYKVKEFVEDFFQSIVDKVAEGNSCAIAGFGKFEPYKSTTTGKITPKFRPGKAFKDAVAK